MPVDLREVARRSGVSISTASRALGGSGLVSPKTRERVEAVATELGYRPNASARALRTGGSRLVGLVITNLVNNSFRVIAEIVQQRLSDQGYHLVLSITEGDTEQERSALHTLLELGASGVVAVGSDNAAFAEVGAHGISVVHLGRRPEKLVGDCVLGSEGAGATAATHLLMSHGHRRIGIVCGPSTVTSGRERLQGYRKALQAAGVAFAPDLVEVGPFTSETGRAAVDRFLSLPRSARPTAILVANHESTYGVLPRLRELSISIPDEISVICYEDAPIMQWWSPAVTAIDNQPGQMAELVARLLIKRMDAGEGATTKPVIHRIPTRMVERSSVAGAPRRAPGPR